MNYIFKYSLIIITLLVSISLFGNSKLIKYTINNHQNITVSIDSSFADSVLNIQNKADSNLINISKDAPDSTIYYSAQDSIIFDVTNNVVTLFNKSQISYKEINLESYNIVLDWQQHSLLAFGILDSNKIEIENPTFKEGEKVYNSKKIWFNYETKKGKIFDLVTKEEEGYIHSKVIKKLGGEEYIGQTADYTTCDAEQPHFSIHSNKIKVIPQKLIITGPAHLIIENVSTPLFLPFAIFPIKKRQNSGLLIPEFNQNQQKGFGLMNGGYYFVIGQHHDLALQGDLFSYGSWALRANTAYKYRYKYNGKLTLNYSKTLQGDPQETNFSKFKDFRIYWNHAQDQRSNPHYLFNANVNFGTSRYDRNNSTNLTEFLTNTYTSSVSYTRLFQNKPFNLNINANHSQNTRDKSLNITLPNIFFSINRINPFERKIITGPKKWYENIGLTYSVAAQNDLRTYDSLLFSSTKLKDFKNVIKHQAAANSSFQVLKYFNFTPSLNYIESWSFEKTSQTRDSLDKIVRNFNNGFFTQRELNGSISFNTRIFGLIQFKKSKLKAIRHIFIPNIGANWHPDYNNALFGYFKNNPDSLGRQYLYSVFENNYLVNRLSPGKMAAITFGINNDLEMKVYDKNDSINHIKKVSLVRSFAFNSNYNFAADSFNLAPISIGGNTTILKKINLNLNGVFDPYKYINGRRTDAIAVGTKKGNGKITNINLSIGSNFTGKTQLNTDKNPKKEYSEKVIDYSKWHIPFNVGFNYLLSIRPTTILFKDTVLYNQSINGTIQFEPTSKWEVNINSGYDFINKKIGITNINVIRNLHCWQLKISATPGYFYSININANASILNDLKIQKRKTFSGYFEE